MHLFFHISPQHNFLICASLNLCRPLQKTLQFFFIFFLMHVIQTHISNLPILLSFSSTLFSVKSLVFHNLRIGPTILRASCMPYLSSISAPTFFDPSNVII